MRYQPNYCCNCGEKIERPNPSFTDSKMFCDVCKHDFVLPRVLPVGFALVMAVIGLFGLGSYWRGGEKTLHPATRQAAKTPGAGVNSASKAAPVNSNANTPQAAPANNVQTTAPPAANPPVLPPRIKNSAPAAETVYFCGAETKKGTPCSRRVRGGGRCWQHQGQTALLPAEKLLVSR